MDAVADSSMASAATLDHVEYEEFNGIGVWTITDFASYFQSEEIERGEAHYREEASKDNMTGTVVAIENAERLGSEITNSLDHINEEWSKLAGDVGISRLAYVADGMMATTVKTRIQADVETESFGSIDEAVDWCRDG